jgi:hypothetical protein
MAGCRHETAGVLPVFRNPPAERGQRLIFLAMLAKLTRGLETALAEQYVAKGRRDD